MNIARWLGIAVLALAMMLMPVLGASAQDATPEGTPVAECVAPALPPGAPTEASPVADEGMEIEEEEAAPVKEGPASRNIAADAEAAMQNLVNCINTTNWNGVAALMTPNMVMWVTGTDNPYDVVAMFEGDPPAPIEIINVSNSVIDTNNRVGMTIVSSGFYAGPGIQIAEKWYFVRDGDLLKLDEIVTTTMPEDLYPDAAVVTVQLVDYAFALDTNSVPTGPVLFKLTNTSYNNEPHVAVMVTLTEGITAEAVISGDGLPDDQLTGFVNATFLEPGQSADFYVADLAPGVYTLACDVETPDGTPHWMLGMVAQFTVE